MNLKLLIFVSVFICFVNCETPNIILLFADDVCKCMYSLFQSACIYIACSFYIQ